MSGKVTQRGYYEIGNTAAYGASFPNLHVFPSEIPMKAWVLGKKTPAWLYSFHELLCSKQGCQLLRILVENQGRLVFTSRIQHEQKGGLWT